MVDILGQAAWHGSIPLALFVAAPVVYWLRGSWLPTRIAAAALLAVAVFLTLITFGWAVVLRDGLGPDMVETDGLLALRRSLADLSVRWLLIAASLAAAGLLLAFVSSRSRSARGVNVG